MITNCEFEELLDRVQTEIQVPQGMCCDEIVEIIINNYSNIIKHNWRVVDIRYVTSRNTIMVSGNTYMYHWVLSVNVENSGWTVIDIMHNIVLKESTYIQCVNRESQRYGGIKTLTIDERSKYCKKTPHRIIFNVGDLLKFNY